ncbi:MAG: AAA family ATPase [Deltaproteobacteria bacterium]|nr:AAA family ATPase [Deltaproteobacteria bacterium]
MGIAHLDSKNISPSILENYGFKNNCFAPDRITIEPQPKLVLYRPAVRKLAEESKSNEYTSIIPVSNTFSAQHKHGYSRSVDARFSKIYNTVANLFNAGDSVSAPSSDIDAWTLFKTKFNEVFAKELYGMKNAYNGTKIGIKLDNGESSSFNTLSTGELEYISLLLDLLFEKMNQNYGIQTADMILIDELDAHFHPDLQRKVISSIVELCNDKYVLITTHSPAVMLSVDSGRLFFLRHSSECTNSDGTVGNQIVLLSDDSSLYSKLAEMYQGFAVDVNLARHFSDVANVEIQAFTDKCLIEEPTALDAACGRETDPQSMTMRAAIVEREGNITIVEFGCGKGRTLSMFTPLAPEKLNTITYIGIDNLDENLTAIKAKAEELSLTNHGWLSFDVRKDPGGLQADIGFMANVLHEISPEDAPNLLTTWFKAIKLSGVLYILEALQLNMGEKDYVMLYPEAIKVLCETQGENLHLFPITRPSSHNGIPLMEARIKMTNPSEVLITCEHYIQVLEKVIEIETVKLVNNHDGVTKLGGLELAFVTHNLANASMFKNKLLKRIIKSS